MKNKIKILAASAVLMIGTAAVLKAACGSFAEENTVLCGGGILCQKWMDTGYLTTGDEMEVSGKCGKGAFSGKACGKDYSDGTTCTH